MSDHTLSWMQDEDEEERCEEEESDNDMNPSIESLAMMAALHRQAQEQEQPQPYLEPSPAAARFYGYGDYAASEDSSSSAIRSTRNASNSSNDSMPSSVPGSPLPADRLARKQRNFPRRGGYCHSALLKSAVMACMSDGPENRNGITASPEASCSTAGDLSVSDLLNNAPANNASPRKRMRRTDRSTTTPQQTEKMKEEEEAVIARATDLLQRLCMKPLDHSSRHTQEGSSRHSREEADGGGGDFERKAPVRRVSRRTSYTSQISAGTDYDDDLDDDDFL